MILYPNYGSYHFLLNEELTDLNVNVFYIEIRCFIEFSIFALVIIFMKCKFFLNTDDIYDGIVGGILFL